DLNDALIDQTTGTTALTIKVDHRVPHGSTLYIDTSAVSAPADNVIIEHGANVTVFVDGVDVNDPAFVAPAWLSVQTHLVFTAGSDNLIGYDTNAIVSNAANPDDTFYAFDPSHVQGGADNIDGGAGWDRVIFDYSLQNVNEDIG